MITNSTWTGCVTRNSDLFVDEEEVKNIIEKYSIKSNPKSKIE